MAVCRQPGAAAFYTEMARTWVAPSATAKLGQSP